MTTNQDNGMHQLPDYRITTGEAPSIAHVAWLGEGDFCRCYLVNGRMVFRYANHAQASAALLREVCLLPILAQQLGTTVPALAFVGQATASGHGLMGYPLLPGTVLEQEILERLPPAHQDLLLAQLASLVRRLHMLPLTQVDPCGVPQLHPASYLSDVLARARRILWPRLTALARQHHETLLAQYLREPLLHRYQPALLHGDLSPDHVLVDLAELRLTGLLDWGDACIGDPAWDLIYILEDYGPQVLDRFVQHYAPAALPRLLRTVRIYQHLNNVAYALALLAAEDAEDDARDAALALLEHQAVAA